MSQIPIRKPDSYIMFDLFDEKIESLVLQGAYKPTCVMETGSHAIQVINHLVWKEMEELYHHDRVQFDKHYVNGEDYTLSTNSCVITRILFKSRLRAATAQTKKNAFDSEHPKFKVLRQRWYDNIRLFLLKIGYIKKITNYTVNGIIDKDGRGDFELVINVKDFMFGQPQQMSQTKVTKVVPMSVSDNSYSPSDVFSCPSDSFGNSDPTLLNLKNKRKETESGAAEPQSSVSVEMSQKKESTPKQGVSESDIVAPRGGEKMGNFVEKPQKLADVVNYAVRLSNFYTENLLTPQYFKSGRIRFNRQTVCSSFKETDFKAEFIALLTHCKQADENSFEYAYDRLLVGMQNKKKYLEQHPNKWIYAPNGYLSIEKKVDSKDFKYTSDSCLRPYHDNHLLQIRGRVSPDLSANLKSIFDTFYPKLIEFGVGDKFLADWTAKLGEEKMLNEIKRIFSKLANGFVPKVSMSKFVKKAIMDAQNLKVVAERAELQAKKTVVKRAETHTIALNAPPTKSNQFSKPDFGKWLVTNFPNTYKLLENSDLHVLYVNFKSLERLAIDVQSVIDGKMQKAQNQKIISQLIADNPELVEAWRKEYRLKKRFQPSFSQSQDEFIEAQLKTHFSEFFKKQSNDSL